jgi:hypothetical protein
VPPERLELDEQDARTIRAVSREFKKQIGLMVTGIIIIGAGVLFLVYPAVVLGMAGVSYAHLVLAVFFATNGTILIRDARRNAAIYRLLKKLLNESERALLSE